MPSLSLTPPSLAVISPIPGDNKQLLFTLSLHPSQRRNSSYCSPYVTLIRKMQCWGVGTSEGIRTCLLHSRNSRVSDPRAQGKSITFSLPDLAVAKNDFFMEMSPRVCLVLFQPCILMWLEMIFTEKRCCDNQVSLRFHPHYPEVCHNFVI